MYIKFLCRDFTESSQHFNTMQLKTDHIWQLHLTCTQLYYFQIGSVKTRLHYRQDTATFLLNSVRESVSGREEKESNVKKQAGTSQAFLHALTSFSQGLWSLCNHRLNSSRRRKRGGADLKADRSTWLAKYQELRRKDCCGLNAASSKKAESLGGIEFVWNIYSLRK